jgi:hypothetical protein
MSHIALVIFAFISGFLAEQARIGAILKSVIYYIEDTLSARTIHFLTAIFVCLLVAGFTTAVGALLGSWLAGLAFGLGFIIWANVTD